MASQIPDFSTIGLDLNAATATAPSADTPVWETPEQISLSAVSTASDLD